MVHHLCAFFTYVLSLGVGSQWHDKYVEINLDIINKQDLIL